MSDQPSTTSGSWQTPPPSSDLPPTPTVDTSEPMTSVQTQTGLLLTAAATVVAFVFHKDFSSLVPPLTVLAFSVFGAAAALARAWKHSTVVKAQTHAQSVALDAWVTKQQHVDIARGLQAINQRLAYAETSLAQLSAPKTRKTSTPRKRTPAKKTSQRR